MVNDSMEISVNSNKQSFFFFFLILAEHSDAGNTTIKHVLRGPLLCELTLANTSPKRVCVNQAAV